MVAIKRICFYLFSPLGRKIYRDYCRLCKNDHCGSMNLSNDPKMFISFSKIQWSIAHRINIDKREESKYQFLKYVRNGYYINNPTVSV